MIYPENFEEKIGFQQVRYLIKEQCLGELGKQFADRISFSSDYELIDFKLSLTEEFRNIFEFEKPFPAQDYFNMIPELRRIRLDGTVIEPEEMFDLKTSLRAIINITAYINKLDQSKFPLLQEEIGDLFQPNEIYRLLEKILDDKGNVRDKASPELNTIRKKLISKKGEIDGKIYKSLAIAKKAGWSSTDAEPTIRGGRLVIPVSATNKRRIKGFIHDESATGQTVYIEPAEIFDTNNEVRELENAERREINRILAEFTDYIRPDLDDLIRLYDFLGMIDFFRANARFAFDIGALKPSLVNKPEIRWQTAIHPLLYLSHKAQKKKIVPLDIELNQDQKILIISGPNTGGKSVCLKTVGLLQYMLQCGIPVPMDKDSVAGIFDKIFIDIGDEQSLENDLSTYSSHLLNLKTFTDKLSDRSLFLIDEFGTGTEPQLGGAIAEAILEKLNKIKAFGVVTTHYSNLKIAADNLQGVVNGAMLFDLENLEPLYQLKIGNPGSSFAFEIAGHIGFPQDILELAAEKTGVTQLDFEKQLQQLEVEKQAINKKKSELTVADDFLSEMIEKYETLSEELERSRDQILLNAKEEAREIISGSNKLIEKTIREIREIQAQKEKTKVLRQKVDEHKNKIEKIKTRPSAQKKKKPRGPKEISGPINVGDHVKISGQDTIGEVEEIRDGKVRVSFDSFQLNTSPDKLQKVSSKEAEKVRRKPTAKYGQVLRDMSKKIEQFNTTIDLRGKRVDEALTIIKSYIDDAVLINIPEVTIVHGKGDGILRQAIRDYLAGIREIKKYQDAHPDRGGHGITIVHFR